MPGRGRRNDKEYSEIKNRLIVDRRRPFHYNKIVTVTILRKGCCYENIKVQ